MRCIVIIGAMEVEVASLKEQMKDIQVTHKASMEFYSGIIEGKNVVVVRLELVRSMQQSAHRF